MRCVFLGRPTRLCLVFLLPAFVASGCATPVGVKRATQSDVYYQLTVNELSGDQPSAPTGQLLRRLNLYDAFEAYPEATLSILQSGLGGADEDDRLFALAELSFAHARAEQSPPTYLAAAAYAYAFVFAPARAEAPDRYDPRARLALDLYNEAVAAGLSPPRENALDLTPRTVAAPFGTMEIVTGSAGVEPSGYRLEDIVSTSEYLVRGLRNRYRRAGIGASVVAQALSDDPSVTQWMPPRRKLPYTVVLRFPDVRASLRRGEVRAEVEVYDPDIESSVQIGNYAVPVESDTTAALAYRLEGSPLWDSELAGFRRGDFDLFGEKRDANLYMLYPYRHGRIPVVLVHGTASSPARWAELSNEILGDPLLASHFQLWFFQYNTGNPVALSAMNLRESLQKIVTDLDPTGHDPALCDIVVIGHSQGGLLTKMTAVDSGDAFWSQLSDKKFEEADLDDETRDLVRRAAFVKPLPCVRRVVFVATPHGGSYLADNFLGNIARKLVTLPAAMTKTGLALVKLRPGEAFDAAKLPTSIDNMKATNPFLKTLRTLPISPGVHAHSIIAVNGEGPPDELDDGVVKYTSAHIEGVDSEVIVRSGHSTQGEPATVEEVRRILQLHLATERGLASPPDSAVDSR